MPPQMWVVQYAASCLRMSFVSTWSLCLSLLNFKFTISKCSVTRHGQKTGCFKIRLNSEDNFSAFSETELSKIVNTWSKWYSSRVHHIDISALHGEPFTLYENMHVVMTLIMEEGYEPTVKDHEERDISIASIFCIFILIWKVSRLVLPWHPRLLPRNHSGVCHNSGSMISLRSRFYRIPTLTLMAES